MTAQFELVLDVGNSTCYTSGQTVTNLSTLGTPSNNNYFLGIDGTVDGREPTFNGVAGALDRSCFFSASANGKIFTPTGTPTILTTAHQAGGQFTIIVGGACPATIATNNYQIANCQAEGGTQGPGVAVRINSSLQPSLLVEGDAGVATFARSWDAALLPSTYFLIGCGIQASNNKSWMYTSTYNNPAVATTDLYTHFSDTFNPVYANISLNPAQSTPTIWQNSGGGTIRSTIGMQLHFMLVSNTFQTQQVILPLMRGLYRRQMSNLP